MAAAPPPAPELTRSGHCLARLNSDTLSSTAAVIVYAIIDSRDGPGEHPFGDVLDVYLNRETAEQGLHGIIHDEPEWERFMSLVEIELTTGNLN
jgi:hypothetical protein